MIRISPAACALGAALLLAACGDKPAANASAPADSANAANAAAAAPAPAPAQASPSGLMGAPAVAQKGVDSSNAAMQRRLDEVNQLSGQAGGGAGNGNP